MGGDPVAITSTVQNLAGAGRSVSALAGHYQQAAATQTTGWSGAAATGYRGTSAPTSRPA